MTKMSPSFIFYLKNFDAMQALTGNDDSVNEEHIKKLLEQSGLKDAEGIVDQVLDRANGCVLRMLLSIGEKITQKNRFSMMSRRSTIQENWHIEHWMYDKRPVSGNGYVLKTQILAAVPEKNNGAYGLITCSIYDTRAKDTILLEKLFGDGREIKKDYDDDTFDKNELPVLEYLIGENDEEEKIVSDFMEKLCKVLTPEKRQQLLESK